MDNSRLDAEIVALDARRKEPRDQAHAVRQDHPGQRSTLSGEGDHSLSGAHSDLGTAKSGKSFWTLDLAMHVALGREYRGKRVHQGSVVYCCFEGQSGISARIEAFRQRFLPEDAESVPFYLQPAPMDLIKEHADLITAIRELDSAPVAVVLDTLNRSLTGSENSDEDMGSYIKARTPFVRPSIARCWWFTTVATMEASHEATRVSQGLPTLGWRSQGTQQKTSSSMSSL